MSFFENSIFAQKMYATCNVLTDAYDYIYDLNRIKRRKKPIPSMYQSFISQAMGTFNTRYHKNTKELRMEMKDDLVITDKQFFTSTASNGEFSFIANLILIETEQTEYFYGYTTSEKFIEPPTPFVRDASEFTQSPNQQMVIIVCTRDLLKAILTYYGFYYNCWKEFFPRSNTKEYINHIFESLIKLSMSAFRYNYYRCLDAELEGMEVLFECDGYLSNIMRNIINIFEDDYKYFNDFFESFPGFASQDAKYIKENLLNHANTTQVQE
mgnify:CR=1 FL=1